MKDPLPHSFPDVCRGQHSSATDRDIDWIDARPQGSVASLPLPRHFARRDHLASQASSASRRQARVRSGRGRAVHHECTIRT